MDAQTPRPLIACSKQHCVLPAVATFRFDYAASGVWLESLPMEADEIFGYKLCCDHADRFTAPVGWQLVDQRSFDGGRAQVESDHPAVRAKTSRGLEIRESNSNSKMQDRVEAILEEHPSGQIGTPGRVEPPEITREIERLALHLALDADTDPGAGIPEDLDGIFGDVGNIEKTGTPRDVPNVAELDVTGTPHDAPNVADFVIDDCVFGDEYVEEPTGQIG